VEAAEQIDNPALLRRALSHLAAAQHRVGDPSAGTSYRRALQISQQLGERGSEALIRLNLGMLLAEQHHDQEALDNLYRAVTLSRDAGERGHEIAEQATSWIEQLGGGQSTMSAGGRASWSDYDQGFEQRGPRGYRERRSDFPEFGFNSDDDREDQALPPG